jgi:hypothetical protein
LRREKKRRGENTCAWRRREEKEIKGHWCFLKKGKKKKKKRRVYYKMRDSCFFIEAFYQWFY